MSITFKEAMANRSANKFAKWPSRTGENRLEPSAEPSFNCGISIQKNSKVLTMGSCFARNIEHYLSSSGYNIPVLRYVDPVDEAGSVRDASILNKYTVASIYEEFEWLAMVHAAGGTVTWQHLEPMVFEVKDGAFHDLQLCRVDAVSPKIILERRQQIYDIHSQFFNCDLAIITPGLTEAWLDTQTGHYIQEAPSLPMLKSNPDRFQFEVLDFFKCFEMLEKITKLLESFGTRQIAFTVSPVPLKNTFTTQDVLIANTYSKATLRSAVGLLCDRNASVRYIPSFERIMLTNKEEVWEGDLRHVSRAFVGSVVQRFAEASSGEFSDTSSLVADLLKASLAADMEQAEDILMSLGPRALLVEWPLFHHHAINIYARKNNIEKALLHAHRLQSLDPREKKGYIKEMQLHSRKGDLSALLKSANRGLENCGLADEKSINQNLVKMLETVFNRSLKKGDTEGIKAVLDHIRTKSIAIVGVDFHIQAANFCLNKKENDGALFHARSIQELSPRTKDGYVFEIKALKQLNDKKGVELARARAIENCRPEDRGTFTTGVSSSKLFGSLANLAAALRAKVSIY